MVRFSDGPVPPSRLIASIGHGGLLPGVAMVRDGLVAMVVGNGMMIEAMHQ
jgi:hypothetical protein